MTSEERVMRAREVLASRATGRRKLAIQAGVDSVVFNTNDVLDAMLAFSDEGSGIGELRTSDANLIKRLREDDDLSARTEAADRIEALASPDIDRSGLAQEVD